MPVVTFSLAWLSLALTLGAAGGVLNATLSHNLSPFPAFVKSPGGQRRVLKIGLAVNICIAAFASTACVWALARPGSFGPQPNGGELLALLVTSVGIGFGAARLATSEADKRLLHEAVCKASAAPAAPPDTVRAIEVAPPWKVYMTTDELVPPAMSRWRMGI
jgi:hypothetical protein